MLWSPTQRIVAHQLLASGGEEGHGALTCNSRRIYGKLSPSGLQGLAIQTAVYLLVA